MKIITTLILLILIFFSCKAYCENEQKSANTMTIDSQILNSYSNKNPFISLIPDKTSKTESDDPEIKTKIQPPPIVAPVLPVVEKKPEPPKLVISGIVWNTNKPQAIINGKVVSQGDKIEGAKVVSIKKSHIELIFNDSKFTIKP